MFLHHLAKNIVEIICHYKKNSNFASVIIVGFSLTFFLLYPKLLKQLFT